MIFILLALLNSLTLTPVTIAESETFIKVTRFQVPGTVRVGDTARLSCAYELGGQSLHALKLFKDDKEFFRYTPGATQREDQRMAFPVAGINLDRGRSSERDVWLKNVNRNTAGVYKCQVSVEETFNSISAERRMEVLNRTLGPGGGGGGQMQADTGSLFALSGGVGGAAGNKNRQPQQRHTVQQQQQQQQQMAKGKATAYGLIPATPGGGQYQYQSATSAGSSSSSITRQRQLQPINQLVTLIFALLIVHWLNAAATGRAS